MMTNEELIEFLIEELDKRDKWIKNIPQELTSIFDNPYIDSLHFCLETMLEERFGKKVYVVFWILFEWRVDKSVEINGITCNTVKDCVIAGNLE